MKAVRRSQTSSSSNSNSPSTSSSSSSSSSSFSWIQLRSVLFVVASSSPAACSSSDRGRLKSPWSLRKRKHVLSSRKWRSMFTSDGKLNDGGIQFLKKVRSGGIDPKIRAEVWPFLLGVYDLGSSKEEREIIRNGKRREYEKLRRQCRRILKRVAGVFKVEEAGRFSDGQENRRFIEGSNSHFSEDDVSDRESHSSDERCPQDDYSNQSSAVMLDGDDGIKQIEYASVVYDSDSKQIEDASVVYDSDSKQIEDASVVYDSDSLETDSSDDPFMCQTFPSMESGEGSDANMLHAEGSIPSKTEVQSILHNTEDFATWQRIIRLDAIRADGEYISYSPSQAAIEDDRARCYAEAVGLKDYDHLEPCRILHAARLVAILEAYALYDPEIGYCQGMSDLLSPIITVMTEDHEAFWCFVEFMKKARHNFRLDEGGIRRQLKIVSKIIKYKDSHLYRHLEKLQAEDCFFVYRMVVVLFRRELTFEQTICLWEVIWADQAAIRACLGKSAWNKIRQHAPPTDDLLLYAIAASVLQRRKQIIEKYSSMDEILKECNSMAGHLDVWKLLDDAHNLVVTLHDKT